MSGVGERDGRDGTGIGTGSAHRDRDWSWTQGPARESGPARDKGTGAGIGTDIGQGGYRHRDRDSLWNGAHSFVEQHWNRDWPWTQEPTPGWGPEPVQGSALG